MSTYRSKYKVKRRSIIRRFKSEEEGSDSHEQRAEKELGEFLRFGPLYERETELNVSLKKTAWDHIEQKSGSDAQRIYERSIRSIEGEAIDCYEIPDMDRPRPGQFREMMVKDGCLFLQLALHILGGGHLLRYSADNRYFGKYSDATSWMHAMFLIGNQIPYCVIRALMRQTFFRQVVEEGIESNTWRCPRETDLPELALYLTVLEPELKRSSSSTLFSRKPRSHFYEPSIDILHALHNLYLGAKDFSPIFSGMGEFHDLEANRYDDDDDDDDEEEKKTKLPGIRELTKMGVSIKPINFKIGGGLAKVRFRDLGYKAKLYLPILAESDTFYRHNLIRYEQSLPESMREMTSYSRFFFSLMNSIKDLKFLQQIKILPPVNEEMLKKPLALTPDEIQTIFNSKLTKNFRQISTKIRDYRSQPRLLSRAIVRSVSVVGAIVSISTIVGTIFTILSYYHQRN